MNTKKLIDEFNSDPNDEAKYKPNWMADLSDDEYRSILGRKERQDSPWFEEPLGEDEKQEEVKNPMELAESVDWREVPGILTEIKS